MKFSNIIEKSTVDDSAVNQIQLGRSKYSLWPSMVAIFLCSGFLWVYSNYSDLFFYAGIIYTPIVGICGIINLFLFRFKKSVSYILPVIFISIFISPSFYSGRETLANARHYVQFMLGETEYDNEVKKMKEIGITYREWKWGNKNIIEYDLIYDESDQIAKPEYQQALGDSCSRTVLKLKSHFYVRTDSCS
jgi:hypothetical protein